MASSSSPIESEEVLDEKLVLSGHRFKLGLKTVSAEEKQTSADYLLAACEREGMHEYYESLCRNHSDIIKRNGELANRLKSAFDTRAAELQAKIDDAVANLGESEIREGWLAKATHLALCGSKEAAVSAYEMTRQKTVGAGERLDVVFALIRLGLFHSDLELIATNIDLAKTLVENGGDWDRKNRLKIYEGVHLMMVRDFKKASALFLTTVSTFTCTELMDYKTFVYYTVLTSTLVLDRPALKKQVIDSPDVRSVMPEFVTPNLFNYLHSLYDSDYRLFFTSLAEVIDHIKTNEYLAPHASFFCREMRIKAYSQLMQSYRSLQIASMASAFGVTEDFIDQEISRFIASNRLHCKIDRVAGIVETNPRIHQKNHLYSQVVKQGDLLLNRLQKLSQNLQ